VIKNILSSKIHSITGAAILVGAASLMSRIIGMLRDRVFAHYYGAGDVMDAYYAAFKIPDLVYSLLIIGALSAGFIPVFIEVMKKNKEESWEVVNGIINILGILLITLSAIAMWQTPALIQWLTPGFSGEKLALTITLTRVMFISPILLGLSSIFGSVLQSYKAFAIYSLTPIMYNMGIIVGAIFLVPLVGTIGLAYGVVLGAFLHLIIQLPAVIQYGYRYRPTLQLHNQAVRTIGKLMIPRMLGAAANQVNVIAITVIASTIGAGSLSIFSFADNLQAVPTGIIGISFAIAIFPTLSELYAEKNLTEMRDRISRIARQIIWLIIPLTIIILLLRAQIVRVVLGTGAFDWEDTILTAHCLAFFSISLFAQSLTPTLTRAFFALKNTWIPLMTTLVSAGINITVGLYASKHWGVPGLAFGYSVSATAQMALLWMLLRVKLGSLNEALVLKTLAKISVAATGMGMVIQALKYVIASIVDMQKFWGIFAQGLISGIVGLIVYGLICYLVRVEEMQIFVESFRKKWFKVKTPDPEIGSIEK
jgi:putative peptidoglycan lipid II flippase